MHFECNVPSGTEETKNVVWIVIGRIQRRCIDFGDLEPVDPSSYHGQRANTTNMDLVPVCPFPDSEEVLYTCCIRQAVDLVLSDGFTRGQWVVGLQSDHGACGISFRADCEWHRREGRQAVTKETGDPTRFSVVQENLKTLPSIALAAYHDSGVGGPIRACLEHEFEIAKRVIADQVAAIAATRAILLADNGAIFDKPMRGVSFRFDWSDQTKTFEGLHGIRSTRV